MLVYSTILGDYDKLREPTAPQSDAAAFVCYTDRTPEQLGWTPKSIWSLLSIRDWPFPGDPLWSARWFKHHPPAGPSIWIDASLQLRVDIADAVNQIRADMACLRHPTRTCVFREFEAAAKRLKGQGRHKDAVYLLLQRDRYREIGVPQNNGLHANGLIFRRDTKAMRQFQERWWDEMLKYESPRDQVSLAKLKWETGFVIENLPRTTIRQFPHEYERASNGRKDGSLTAFG